LKNVDFWEIEYLEKFGVELQLFVQQKHHIIFKMTLNISPNFRFDYRQTFGLTIAKLSV